MPATTMSTRPAGGVPSLLQRRWIPATPTSKSTTPAPINSASLPPHSHGKIDVPAVTTAMKPAPRNFHPDDDRVARGVVFRFRAKARMSSEMLLRRPLPPVIPVRPSIPVRTPRLDPRLPTQNTVSGKPCRSSLWVSTLRTPGSGREGPSPARRPPRRKDGSREVLQQFSKTCSFIRRPPFPFRIRDQAPTLDKKIYSSSVRDDPSFPYPRSPPRPGHAERIQSLYHKSPVSSGRNRSRSSCGPR